MLACVAFVEAQVRSYNQIEAKRAYINSDGKLIHRDRCVVSKFGSLCPD